MIAGWADWEDRARMGLRDRARRRPVTWRAVRAVGWARTKRARTAPAEPRSRSWKTSAAPV